MALYLVVHDPPAADAGDGVQAPTRMLDLARDLGPAGSSPRWLRTWSPDLNDDRLFSMWEAERGDQIVVAMDAYGFLGHLAATPLRVQEWGPDDIIRAHDAPDG